MPPKTSKSTDWEEAVLVERRIEMSALVTEIQQIRETVDNQSGKIEKQTEQLSELNGSVREHIATDAQYRKLTEEHEKKIKGNGGKSYDSRLDSLNSRMRMIFIIGGSLATFMLGIAGTTIAALLLEWFYIVARYPNIAGIIGSSINQLLSIQ
jgi:hypothetical protein